jgi:hypothetical protein
MPVIEPSFALKRRNGYQTAGRRLALRARLRPQLELWLGLAQLTVYIQPLKVKLIKCSEASANYNLMRGITPPKNTKYRYTCLVL